MQKNKFILISIVSMGILTFSVIPPAHSAKSSNIYALFNLGNIQIKKSGQSLGVVPSLAYVPVENNQEIRTKEYSQAQIYWEKLMTVRLHENSVLQIIGAQVEGKRVLAHLKLVSGEMLINMNGKPNPKSDFKLLTASILITVQQGVFVVKASTEGLAQVQVLEGNIKVNKIEENFKMDNPLSEGAFTIPFGKEINVLKTGSLELPSLIDPTSLSKNKNWLKEPDYQSLAEKEFTVKDLATISAPKESSAFSVAGPEINRLP